MTQEFFKGQIERMQSRFGLKPFDNEFVKLIWREVLSMPEEDFVGMINFFIGSKPTTRPPLLEDFRNGRLTAERNRFQQDVRGAANVFEHPAQFGGLKVFLSKEYPGCKSLKEALEVQTLRNQFAAIDDPPDGPDAA